MKSQDHKAMTAQTVKLGASGQVVIPKIFHEELGLRPGDYFEAELHEGKVVLTPKVLVRRSSRHLVGTRDAVVAAMDDDRVSRVVRSALVARVLGGRYNSDGE